MGLRWIDNDPLVHCGIQSPLNYLILGTLLYIPQFIPVYPTVYPCISHIYILVYPCISHSYPCISHSLSLYIPHHRQWSTCALWDTESLELSNSRDSISHSALSYANFILISNWMRKRKQPITDRFWSCSKHSQLRPRILKLAYGYALEFLNLIKHCCSCFKHYLKSYCPCHPIGWCLHRGES